MSYSINFLPEVETDVQEAYKWYEEQLTGLGEDFLLSTDAAINSILRTPLHNQVTYKQVRKLKTKRFPFGIFYVVQGSLITVISIAHLSRHPRTWKKRSRKTKK